MCCLATMSNRLKRPALLLGGLGGHLPCKHRTLDRLCPLTISLKSIQIRQQRPERCWQKEKRSREIRCCITTVCQKLTTVEHLSTGEVGNPNNFSTQSNSTCTYWGNDIIPNTLFYTDTQKPTFWKVCSSPKTLYMCGWEDEKSGKYLFLKSLSFTNQYFYINN